MVIKIKGNPFLNQLVMFLFLQISNLVKFHILLLCTTQVQPYLLCCITKYLFSFPHLQFVCVGMRYCQSLTILRLINSSTSEKQCGAK